MPLENFSYPFENNAQQQVLHNQYHNLRQRSRDQTVRDRFSLFRCSNDELARKRTGSTVFNNRVSLCLILTVAIMTSNLSSLAINKVIALEASRDNGNAI